MRFRTYSYRFSEQVLNSKLELKKEIEDIIRSINVEPKAFSRPELNRILEGKFTDHEWESQPTVFDEPKDPSARIDFLKERIGIEVGFGHSSFIGIDRIFPGPPERGNRPYSLPRDSHQWKHNHQRGVRIK